MTIPVSDLVLIAVLMAEHGAAELLLGDDGAAVLDGFRAAHTLSAEVLAQWVAERRRPALVAL